MIDPNHLHEAPDFDQRLAKMEGLAQHLGHEMLSSAQPDMREEYAEVFVHIYDIAHTAEDLGISMIPWVGKHKERWLAHANRRVECAEAFRVSAHAFNLASTIRWVQDTNHKYKGSSLVADHFRSVGVNAQHLADDYHARASSTRGKGWFTTLFTGTAQRQKEEEIDRQAAWTFREILHLTTPPCFDSRPYL